MRYALLIYGRESDYDSMTPDEQTAMMQGHATLAEEMLQRNMLTGGAQLQRPKTATTVRVRSGKIMRTDGPFAETKEQLGGFYVVDCKDLDEAIAFAAKIPDAMFGAIEIRPILE
jgi:hypothetical protein